jgi:N-acetylmuramoyl-L-alanine amidase
MFAAAFRQVVLALVTLVPDAPAADGVSRAAPTRPAAIATVPDSPKAGAVATRKFGHLDYVNVADVAARLSLKLTWVVRGRKLTLSGPAGRAELEADSRDIQVNGVRVFLGDPIIDSGSQLYVSRLDAERCLTPLLRPGHGVVVPSSPRTIVLDPGHGGKDNGTSSNEKIFALDVAVRAKKLLQAAGFNVILTRENDSFLELADRASFANAKRADLFASIHFNAIAKDSKTTGVEVFTFAPANQHSTEWWSAPRMNDPHFETTEEPVNRFDHWSVVLAHAVHRRFVSDLKTFDRGKKLAHWGVLRPLNCPGILIECGFLTSDVEARRIATAAYRQKLAATIAAGIRDYSATVNSVRPKTAAAPSSGSASSVRGSTD